MNRPRNPVYAFYNLNTAVFDEKGEQIPELQVSLAALFAEHLVRNGHNPEGVIIETQWGSRWQIFKTTDGTWNHRNI